MHTIKEFSKIRIIKQGQKDQRSSAKNSLTSLSNYMLQNHKERWIRSTNNGDMVHSPKLYYESGSGSVCEGCPILENIHSRDHINSHSPYTIFTDGQPD